ncbi:crosslink repair DNA glycosylase YcaQ family protein [Luedemannella flava]|uniref:Crosslink repair DNA glycosylase YcaQ family protein n=1 Tax=Luedemannella flava TaxID=349316 RepID=A0ABN2LIJ5_9ACTN
MTRARVLGFRVHAQQLDRESTDLVEAAVLDLGAQETGPDGGRWALALRGVDTGALAPDALADVWTIRGAPHLYRRADLAQVAAAVAPFSDADAAKRIYDAARPLRAAGIGVVDALDTVAAAMRTIVTKPTVKGAVSTRLTAVMPEPYLRECRPCQATHLYEMPFRLAALRAGLELQHGTSPPVLTRIPKFKAAAAAGERFDVIRAYLRLLGPATPQHVAAYLDAPVTDVKRRWPDDAVEVRAGGERRWILAADEARLRDGPPARGTRLLGPYDLFLQAKDRALVVPDAARAKQLWPVLGRPGAVLHDGEVVGLWRPRAAGRTLAVAMELWARVPMKAVEAQAERLAAFRDVRLTGVTTTGPSA